MDGSANGITPAIRCLSFHCFYATFNLGALRTEASSRKTCTTTIISVPVIFDRSLYLFYSFVVWSVALVSILRPSRCICGQPTWGWRYSFVTNYTRYNVYRPHVKIFHGWINMMLDETGTSQVNNRLNTSCFTITFINVSHFKHCSRHSDIALSAATRLKHSMTIVPMGIWHSNSARSALLLIFRPSEKVFSICVWSST